MTTRSRNAPVRATGFTLVEVMVGTTVALLGLVVIAHVLLSGERVTRNVIAAGDAEVTAAIAAYTLGAQAANAGSAIAFSGPALDPCPDPGDPSPVRGFARSWRPVPVLAIDGGSPDVPDAIALYQSHATAIFAPAPIVSSAAARHVVRSPNGFHPRVAGERKDLVVAVESTAPGTSGSCAPTRVEAVRDASGSCSGCVEVTTTGTALAHPSLLVNLGPGDDAAKVLYDVDRAKAVLRRTTLVDDRGLPSTASPVPLASNVVLLKVQYGIDDDGDGVLDGWASGRGAWAPDIVLAAPVATLRRIVAVRIGIVVRSDQFDREFREDVRWSLFDGTFAGVLPQSSSPPGNWRYRTYEATIPLRNALWNALP